MFKHIVLTVTSTALRKFEIKVEISLTNNYRYTTSHRITKCGNTYNK